jgi:selenocysteine lyase/cysteine desulfurase
MKRLIDSFCEGPLLDWTEWNGVMEEVRGLLARLLSASADEIGFNYNTSLSLMLLSRCVDWHKGDNIVIPDREFPSVVMPGKLLQQWGVEARVIPAVGDLADTDKLLGAIDSRTRMMMVSLVNFLTGQRLDIKKLAKGCREAGVVLVVDAIQAAGPIKIDVKDLGCHALCFGNPKWMMGPMGIGTMYVDRDSIDLLKIPQVGMFSVPEPWNFFDYDQPFVCSCNRYECGTQPVISHYGYRPILEMFLDLGPENIERYLLDLTGKLHDELTRRGVKVITPRNDRDRAAIVTFDAASAGWPDAQALRDTLFKAGVVVSLRMGLIRVSPHFYNTWDEVERLLELVFK